MQSVKCIRFGYLLLDENRQAFLLCLNCHEQYDRLDKFRKHLEQCKGYEFLFDMNTKLELNGEPNSVLMGRPQSDRVGVREYQIYNHNEVQSTDSNFEEFDLAKLERELLDPRWYESTDASNAAESVQCNTARTNKDYKHLVQEITPFVQFKENINGRKLGKEPAVQNKPKTAATAPSCDLKTQMPPPSTTAPIARRRLSMQIAAAKPNIAASARSQTAISSSRSSMPAKPNAAAQQPTKMLKSVAQAAVTNGSLQKPSFVVNQAAQKANNPAVVLPAAPAKQTQQILNKLQNLGLQVKRTAPAQSPEQKSKSQETLQLLKKLQSNGMNVKLLNKNTQAKQNATLPAAKSIEIPMQKMPDAEAVAQISSQNIIKPQQTAMPPLIKSQSITKPNARTAATLQLPAAAAKRIKLEQTIMPINKLVNRTAAMQPPRAKVISKQNLIIKKLK